MPNSKKIFIQVSAAVLTIATTSQAIASALQPETRLAQAANPTSFPLPSAVPSGTAVKVDGSPSMTVINEALKKGFEDQFSGTKVDLASSSTDEALKSLLDGKIDLAAIGRPLSAEEKAKGLKETPIGREKIAIVVGSDNPFRGDLTFEQFAKIFRGEITDWSEVGGAPGAIRFIDRPASSDTRLSLSRYKVFQAAPFQDGSTATQAAKDDTATVIDQLGKDGISYAIVSQVANQSNIKIVPMHRTLPDNPAYPYSQPRSYVYKGEASPAIAAFLGFASSAPGQAAVQDVKLSEGAAAAGLAAGSASPSSASPSPASPSSALPITSPTSSPEAASPNVAAGTAVIASPSTSPDAASGVSPSASPSDTALVPSAGDSTADRSGFPGWLGWLLLPLIAGGIWWLTRRGASAPAEPPAPIPAPIPTPAPVPPVGAVGAVAGGAAIAGATALGVGAARAVPDSRIILTPRDSQNAYAYWETPDRHKAALRDQGGRDLKLRVTDVTDDVTETDANTPSSPQEFDLSETDRDLHVPIPQADRDYIAQIGYKTPDGKWLELARSNAIRVPSAAIGVEPSLSRLNAGGLNAGGLNAGGLGLAAGGAALATGAGLAAAGASDRLLDRNTVIDDSRLILAARTPEAAYAYWETPAASKTALQTQGGQQFQLRLYDTTHLDLDEQPAHSVQTFPLNDSDRDLHVALPQPDRDYTAEIGYETANGQWLKLARSNELRIAAELGQP